MNTASDSTKWPLKVVLVQDPRIGGFTAFFKQFPDVITEGDNEKEAIENLLNAIHDVFEYQSREEMGGIDPSFRVIERPIHVGLLDNAC